MLLRTRRDEHGLDTGLDTRELARTSRMVTRFTGYAVQPNKAIVGRNAFAHESGIHQDGVLKERTTYEIMDATDVGLESNSIVLGKHSGRHALRDALEQLGLQGRGQRAQPGVQALQGDRGQEEAGDRARPRGDRLRPGPRGLGRLRARLVRRRGLEPARADGEGRGDDARRLGGGRRVRRRRAGRRDLRRRSAPRPGSSPSSAQYTVSAVTEGEDALGEVTVMVRAHGRLASGQGVATDILEASARAYVRAMSNALEGAAVREAEGVTAEAASAAGDARALTPRR